MPEKLIFTPTINEGDAGCIVEIEEFGIQVGAPTRDVAVYGIGVLL